MEFAENTTQQTQPTCALANLLRTCYGNWCNGFWRLPSKLTL